MRNRSTPIGQLKQEFQDELQRDKINLHEDLQQLWATETCETMRAKYAEMYERATGLSPEINEQIRDSLQAVLNETNVPL